MEASKKEKLIGAGVNLETAMERFMENEELLLHFLAKLSEDTNYETFKTAMAEKNYADAFKAAHTLKGLCGNLSLDSLYEVVGKEVEFLRNGRYAEAEEAFPEVTEKFDETLKMLESI